MNQLRDADRQWMNDISKLSCAKPLMQHLGCINAIRIRAGQTSIDSAMDQVNNMKKVFVHNYEISDAPFGLRLNTGKLPKCICLCNLSGKHAFFYSESVSLARTMTHSSELANSAVDDVISRASELDASVLVVFSLPFQAGLNRAYFEVRTIRKTKKGAVKDGELFFSSHNTAARTVPCTLSLENWTDEMLTQMTEDFKSVCSPVSLDVSEDGAELRVLSREEAIAMIDVLKCGRKKLIESHERALVNVKENARRDVEKYRDDRDAANSSVESRIDLVVEQCKAVEETWKKKHAAVEEQNRERRKELAALRPRLQGMELEHSQELEKAAARQKAVESQVSSLQSNHAKQVSDQARARKDSDKKHANQIKEITSKYEASEKRAHAMKVAAEAVTKSAEEARRMYAESQATLAATMAEYEIASANTSTLKDELDALKVQHESLNAQHVLLTKQKTIVDDEILSSVAEKALHATHVQVLQTALSEEERTHKETRKELKRTTHLLSETTKRTTTLQSRISELEDDAKKAKKQLAATLTFPGNGRRKAHEARDVPLGIVPAAPIAYPQPQHPYPTHAQQHGFPSGFEVDPHLEGMISQLHGALQSITATARLAKTSTRNAEMFKAKLDALASVGYYEVVPNVHN